MNQPKPTDGSASVGYCDCCGEWSDDLSSPTSGRHCFDSCPKCDGRKEKLDNKIVEVCEIVNEWDAEHSRTEMKCKLCGQFSSSQYCWYCTQRMSGKDPIILENIRLRKEVEMLKNRIPNLNI